MSFVIISCFISVEGEMYKTCYFILFILGWNLVHYLSKETWILGVWEQVSQESIQNRERERERGRVTERQKIIQEGSYVALVSRFIRLNGRIKIYFSCLLYVRYKPAPRPRKPSLQWVLSLSRGLKRPESVANYHLLLIPGCRWFWAILPLRLCAWIGMPWSYLYLLVPVFRFVSLASSISSILIHIHTTPPSQQKKIWKGTGFWSSQLSSILHYHVIYFP